MEVVGPELHFEFVRGQRHYQKGGKKEELLSPEARSGWEFERFWHEKKIKKAEWN